MAIRPPDRTLPAGDRAHDEEGFAAIDDLGRQRGVGRVAREVAAAGKEAEVRAAALRGVITRGTAEHGVGRFERIEEAALRGRAVDLQFDLALDAREHAQGCRQHDANHGRVCTSTESTAGRSRTIGFHESPPLAEAYTCPPVVPMYTPQGSSASTAIASRSTLT